MVLWSVSSILRDLKYSLFWMGLLQRHWDGFFPFFFSIFMTFYGLQQIPLEPFMRRSWEKPWLNSEDPNLNPIGHITGKRRRVILTRQSTQNMSIYSCNVTSHHWLCLCFTEEVTYVHHRRPVSTNNTY